MSLTFGVVVFTVALALVFDAINGFHDAANSIATIVSTRVLTPKAAVLWAAFFNFAAIFLGVKVAKFVASIVKIDPADSGFIIVVLAGLVGAIVWDLLTWWWGLPTSSSHALIGGLCGAALAYKRTWAVLQLPKITKTALFIPVAPALGFVLGITLFFALVWIFRKWRPGKVDTLFRKLQLFSAAAYSVGHGGNDAQKTMGVIVALLVASGHMKPDDSIPWWIIISCLSAMAFGTAFGGWRIVKTMGMKITKLGPPGGFCAETAGALTLFLATHFGIPVSTTHTITGSIIGVGATRGISAVRWGIASRIVVAWVVTIPASAAVAALTFWALAPFLT